MKWKASWRKKDLWNLARNKALQDRGALPRRDAITEYKAVHEENFLGSWLREDGKSKTKEDKEIREDVGRRGKRVREKEEDETVVKRKRVNPVSVEDFDIFSQGEISECDSCGVNSDCESGKWPSELGSNDIYVPFFRG